MKAAYKMYQRKSGITYIVNAFGRVVYIKNKWDTSYWKIPKTNIKLRIDENVPDKIRFIQDLTAEELVLELL